MHRKNTNRRRYLKTGTERRRYTLAVKTTVSIDRYKLTQIFTDGQRDDWTDRQTDTDKRKYAQTCTESVDTSTDRQTQAGT